MAQTEFQRGWLAGCYYMRTKAIWAAVSIEMPEAPKEKEAQ